MKALGKQNRRNIMEKKVKREATYSRPKSGGSFDNKDRNERRARNDDRKGRAPRKFDDNRKRSDNDDNQGKRPFRARDGEQRRERKDGDWKGNQDRPRRKFDGENKRFDKREDGERRPYKKFDGEDRPKRPFGGEDRRERPVRSWNEVKLSGEEGNDETAHRHEFREHAPEDKRPVTARQVAYRALKKIYEQSLFIDVALENQTNYSKLNPQDKAFARWLVAGVVRYQKRLNHILEQFWKREPDLQIKIILQMGALQLLLGDNAEHAVVSETVSLCGQKDAQYRGLVNAILRNIIRSDIQNLEGLDAVTEYPRWILADWSETFGEDTAKDIARQSLEEAEVDISFKMENADVFLDLAKARPLPGGGARLKGHKGRVNRLPGFKNGAFWVQDAAAQLPVKLLGDIKGKKALDLCAAPGGKSLQMVANGAVVTAVDLKDRRMQRLKDNFERVRFDIDTVIADVCLWENADKYDIVMLDAPCSATGTLRRHPEILRQRSRDEVAELVELQKTMLNRAKDWLTDDGVMVYCVCSLQASEGVEQIESFLADNPDWEKIDLKDRLEELKLAAAYHKGYAYTHAALWQKIGGMDGFFIALLIKRPN